MQIKNNVFIVTDGLPTQGATPPVIKKTIDGDGRLTEANFLDPRACDGIAGDGGHAQQL
jgi:hypothetical protein